MAVAPDTVSSAYAAVLLDFQLAAQKNPFEIATRFKTIAAAHALHYQEALSEGASEDHSLLFERWDLETKLWHLIELLYSFRLAQPEPLVAEYGFSSTGVKTENFLRRNPSIRELSIIICWLQINSPTVETGDAANGGKWHHTRLALANKDLNSLVSKKTSSIALVDSLDADAPLRTGKGVEVDDEAVDSANFLTIYRLVLADKMQEAIDYANSTGNFTLALIIVGAIQDHFDPLLDKNATHDLMEDEPKKASGLKHKLLWLRTVSKLAQQPNLNKNERLIYTYLSGGDISANLREASGSWEESLLLYLHQLYISSLGEFLQADAPEQSLYFPKALSSVGDALNVLLKGNNEVSEQSTHPIRVILGSVMINELATFLQTSVKSNRDVLVAQPYLLRLVTHLSIFLMLVDNENRLHPKTITRSVTLYVSHLNETGIKDLIPVYLSFIPDEKDARESYSLFLSTIVDAEHRSKQLETVKKFSRVPAASEDSSSTDDFDNNEDKLVNVLRRTVERVMTETEPYYRQQDSVSVTERVDEMDLKLCRSVDWFYEGKIYEDAISSSLVIIRRFLLTGKLGSLKRFHEGKNFKVLIKDYDIEYQTKALGSPNPISLVSEDNKEELLQYASLVECLTSIDDWKEFLAETTKNNPANLSQNLIFWKSKDIEKSIEKTTKKITSLINTWFKGPIKAATSAEDRAIFSEFRSIYIPYVIIELLQIYQDSRYHDWKYMRLAFKLVNQVADDDTTDFLQCFEACGRLSEFVRRAGELAVVASEKGVKGIFY